MDIFLAEVEKKAFRMARYAVKDSEEALDIVQEAMFMLVRKYAHKPKTEWRPLFFRILQNRIVDWHRRLGMRRRFFRESTSEGAPGAGARGPQDLHGLDAVDLATGPATSDPMVQANLDGAMDQMQQAIEALPVRQQQAFLLRTMEGMKVADTAAAMGCSEGSVKTHYSRAVRGLRNALKEHWE